MLWTHGVETGRLTMNEFVAVTSTNIAKILNVYPQKGAIAEGADADIVVLDPAKEKTISAANQQSAIDYNVFEGRHVKGLPRYVLSRGKVVVDDGAVKTEEGHGQFVAREPFPAVCQGAVEMERADRAAQGGAQQAFRRAGSDRWRRRLHWSRQAAAAWVRTPRGGCVRTASRSASCPPPARARCWRRNSAASASPARTSRMTTSPAFVDAAMARWGRIDVLVNSAGHGPRAPILELTDEDWHRGLDVYLMNVIRATRAVAPSHGAAEIRRDHQHIDLRRLRARSGLPDLWPCSAPGLPHTPSCSPINTRPTMFA